MKQRQLGKSGPMVSAIGLGCMSFGGIFGPTSTDESFRCLDAALDHGISFFDTANIYGMGVSEEVLGQWMALRKPDVVLATKASIVAGPLRRFDNSERHLREELQASLKRLGREHVDLFYIHRREAERPIEEVAGSLSRMIEEGLIGGYGLSEIAPGTLRRAHAVHPCRAVQNEYSLWTRAPELGLIQSCAELGVAFVPFSPLGRGAFGREIVDPANFGPGDFRLTIPRFQGDDWPYNVARIEAFRRFAAEIGTTAPALSMAWILDQADHLIPIPGTRRAEHLADWAKADQITFSEEISSNLARLMPVGWAHGDRYGIEQASSVERYC